MQSLKDLIWGYFPWWYHEADTYKDGNNKGVFQRYLEALANEWDDELTPKLEGVRDLNDSINTDDKFLRHLAWFLGNPPDMVYSDARYRKLLRYIHGVNIYKGTEEGYKRLFRLLGLGVSLVIHELVDYQYDNSLLNYDDTVNWYRYDSECPSCTEYSLTLVDEEGYLTQVFTDLGANSQPVVDIIMALIKYVEPINMRLRLLTFGSDPILNDKPWVLTTGIWNDNLKWNNYKIYKDNPD